MELNTEFSFEDFKNRNFLRRDMFVSADLKRKWSESNRSVLSRGLKQGSAETGDTTPNVEVRDTRTTDAENNQKIFAQRIEFDSIHLVLRVRPSGINPSIEIKTDSNQNLCRKELGNHLEKVFQSAHSTSQKGLHELRNRVSSTTMALHALIRRSENSEELDNELLQMTIDELHVLDELAVRLRKHSKIPFDELIASKTPIRVAMIVIGDRCESLQLGEIFRSKGFSPISAADLQSSLIYLEKCHRVPECFLLDSESLDSINAEQLDMINDRQIRIFAIANCQETLDVETSVNGIHRWFHRPYTAEEIATQIEKELVA